MRIEVDDRVLRDYLGLPSGDGLVAPVTCAEIVAYLRAEPNHRRRHVRRIELGLLILNATLVTVPGRG